MSIKSNNGTFIKSSIMLLILVLLLLLWTKPSWQNIKTISQALTNQSQAIKNIPTSNSWATLNAYLANREKELTGTNNLFRTKGQELGFFARLESLAEAQQLPVKLSLGANGPAIIAGADTLVINLETQGNQVAVLRFLQSLEKEPGLLPAQVNLTSNTDTTLNLQISIQNFWR